MWLTCCALHNFLLDVDRYDEMRQSERATAANGFAEERVFGLQRLANPDTTARPVQTTPSQRNFSTPNDQIVNDENMYNM